MSVSKYMRGTVLGALIMLTFSVGAQTSGVAAGEVNPSVPSKVPGDSLVVVSAGGDTSVTYLPNRYDFGALPARRTDIKGLKFSPECYLEASAPPQKGAKSAAGACIIDTTYTVGQIPYEEGLTPSGARIYTIPVITAAGLPQVPSISLRYNSQAGNGVAGYGWTIGGVSVITQTNKNIYYHGTSDAASLTEPEFALDGVPLVQNTDILSDTYPYITARGHILARITESAGYARRFEVLYPDGSRAEYGVSLYSTMAVLSYPVTRIEDVRGNYMTFSYIESDGVYHISDIRYGGDATRPLVASIHFGYEDRDDYVNRYFLGKTYSERKVLKTVTSSVDGEELRTYRLFHTSEEGTTLLAGLSCTVGEETILPLTFGYGNEEYVANDFAARDSIILSSAFTQSGNEFIYRRGKLVPDSCGDGIIIYPSFSTYAQLERVWVPFDYRYRYGSSYSPDQAILIFPYNRTFFSQARTIVAGEGFQTVEAVDVDGDGVDEIVKVNHNGTGSNRTNLLITIYEYDGDTEDFTSRTINTYVTGNVENPRFTSPSQLAYYFGDYVGDGKTRLLVYSYDENCFGKSQTSEGTVIDLEDGTVLKRQTVFGLSLDDAKNIISLDIDADSRTELCRFTATGMNAYSYQGTDSGFTLDGTYPGVTSNDMTGSADATFVTDLNADGYIDIVNRNTTSDVWSVRSFNGQQFVSGTFNVPHYEGDKFMFMDVNRDGLPDLVVARQNRLHTYLNQNGEISPTINGSHPISGTEGILPCNITNYNGMSNFIKVDGDCVYCYTYLRNLQERRLLTSFGDGFGKRTENEYREMSSCVPMLGYVVPEVYDIDASLPSDGDGFCGVAMPLYLLYDESVKMSVSGEEQVIRANTYRYFNATASTLGLGFCGFRMIRVLDTMGGASQWRSGKTYYDPEKFCCVIRQEQGMYYNQEPISVTEMEYDNNSSPYGKLNPRLTSTMKTDALTGVAISTIYTYGSYDLPALIQTRYSIGADALHNETTVLTYRSLAYQNSISPTKYALGTVGTETVVREAGCWGYQTWKTRTVMTYDGSLRPLTKKTYVGTDGTSLLSEQRWQYDVHGNVTSEKSASYGATTFNETTYTYDTLGRHLISDTDILGRTMAYSGYDKYGNPSLATDWLGRSTEYDYDTWGNLTKTTLPDSTVQAGTMAWSVAGEPGLFRVTNTVTGRPATRVWYDALGREVRSANLRYDGSWQYAEREYDSRGRLLRTSLPYKDTAAGPTYWNTYAYDVYDRPVSLHEAGGKQTTWEYSGTSTTTTSDGVSTTITTNASGDVIRVSDPGGAITYTLRDDAQPAKVTVTPAGSSQSVETTFSYDSVGRRTAIVDPSAGSRTTAYTDNADGTSSVASTGPNGTVTTHYDRYGRVSGISRPEFNTTFTYGTSSTCSSYGKLLSEISTNGTARTYTYDNLGRVITETEYADADNWLRKTYGYGEGSNVVSVGYSNGDGAITTESFEYANGHNAAVTASQGNGITVWRKTAENVLGQPMAITTGTAHRTYAFTSTGIPQGRMVRSAGNDVVHDLYYSYDSVSGNMLWRQDNVFGYRETFAYDSHNRLQSALQTFTDDIRPELDYSQVNMSYATNGNVLHRDNDGILHLSLEYADSADPYRTTGSVTDEDHEAYVPEYGHITMTSFDRPAGIGFTESDLSTQFTYNAGGERTKMTRDEGLFGIYMDRYYLGEVYEKDIWSDGTGVKLTT
ncbi:MAG: hypothetical protein HUJ91_03440, partial [Bacteroidales bacterium]|nr:hypothetical protein [Bacteroidales bacterium]